MNQKNEKKVKVVANQTKTLMSVNRYAYQNLSTLERATMQTLATAKSCDFDVPEHQRATMCEKLQDCKQALTELMRIPSEHKQDILVSLNAVLQIELMVHQIVDNAWYLSAELMAHKKTELMLEINKISLPEVMLAVNECLTDIQYEQSGLRL